ncbi:unnamed protein product [Parajaminaea phylloscopi]
MFTCFECHKVKVACISTGKGMPCARCKGFALGRCGADLREFQSKNLRYVVMWKALTRRAWCQGGGKLLKPIDCDYRSWHRTTGLHIDPLTTQLRQQGWLAPSTFGWDLEDVWTGWKSQFIDRGLDPAMLPFQPAAQGPLGRKENSSNKRARLDGPEIEGGTAAVAAATSTIGQLLGAANGGVTAPVAPSPSPVMSAAVLPSPCLPMAVPVANKGPGSPLSARKDSPTALPMPLRVSMGPPAHQEYKSMEELPKIFQRVASLFADGIYIDTASALRILEQLDELAAYLPCARAYGLSALAFLKARPGYPQRKEVEGRRFPWLEWKADESAPQPAKEKTVEPPVHPGKAQAAKEKTVEPPAHSGKAQAAQAQVVCAQWKAAEPPVHPAISPCFSEDEGIDARMSIDELMSLDELCPTI